MTLPPVLLKKIESGHQRTTVPIGKPPPNAQNENSNGDQQTDPCAGGKAAPGQNSGTPVNDPTSSSTKAEGEPKPKVESTENDEDTPKTEPFPKIPIICNNETKTYG